MAPLLTTLFVAVVLLCTSCQSLPLQRGPPPCLRGNCLLQHTITTASSHSRQYANERRLSGPIMEDEAVHTLFKRLETLLSETSQILATLSVAKDMDYARLYDLSQQLAQGQGRLGQGLLNNELEKVQGQGHFGESRFEENQIGEGQFPKGQLGENAVDQKPESREVELTPSAVKDYHMLATVVASLKRGDDTTGASPSNPQSKLATLVSSIKQDDQSQAQRKRSAESTKVLNGWSDIGSTAVSRNALRSDNTSNTMKKRTRLSVNVALGTLSDLLTSMQVKKMAARSHFRFNPLARLGR